ncbi:MAG TPA: hypothetical protein VLB46_11470 [Pyrinomonadaceae bacterium]|nr:hypothetical protein [Pyrinomonadaceae bacterium]
MMLYLLLIVSLVFTSVGIQQPSKPDFTGVWNARILADPKVAVEGLRITYNDPKLEVLRVRNYRSADALTGSTTGTRKFVYYTDGRGETQKPIFPGAPPSSNKSKTQRVGEKFVTTESTTANQSGNKITTERTVTLEVSSDGKTLTETTTFVSEGNTQRRVHLYERVSGANRNINGEWTQRPGNRLISLTVEHHDPEIKVTRRVVSAAQDETDISIYNTDARGEINVKSGQPVKSVTKWNGQSLVFSLSNKTNFDGDTFELKQLINWEISSDGASLVEVTESRMSASAGFISQPPGAVTLIYARSSKRLPE